MQYLGEYSSMDQIVFPSQSDGVTMVINRYRDDLGKVMKIAVDILPIVVTMAVGPQAGAVSSVAVAGGRMSKALYDYLVSPESSKTRKGKNPSAAPISNSLVELGDTALGTLRRMICEDISQDPQQLPIADIAETSAKVVKGALKRKKRAVIEIVAAKGLKQVVAQTSQSLFPKVVLNLFEAGHAVASTAFRTFDFIGKVVDLRRSAQDLSHVIEIDKRAEAAIKLVQESSKGASKRERVQIKKAIKTLQEDSVDRKTKVRSANKKGFCTIL
jgi:hypothetical protein